MSKLEAAYKAVDLAMGKLKDLIDTADNISLQRDLKQIRIILRTARKILRDTIGKI